MLYGSLPTECTHRCDVACPGQLAIPTVCRIISTCDTSHILYPGPDTLRSWRMYWVPSTSSLLINPGSRGYSLRLNANELQLPDQSYRGR